MRVLLAIDGSQSSAAAREEVALRPWPAGSAVRVVNAVELAHPYGLGVPLVEAIERNAKALVDGVVEELCKAGLTADGLVAHGEPRTAVLEQAGEWKADLIVTGAHGAGAVERLLLGSVSRAILRHASCPVEVVRWAGARPPGHRILLGVDGSEGSAAAVKAVAALPWPAGTEVRLLSAVEVHLGLFRAAFEVQALDPTHLEPQREEAMRRAQQAVHEASQALEAAGMKVSESISVLPAKQALVNEAAGWNATLIVLGSHGRRRLDRFLLGSTSESVATHAGCPVQLVRTGGLD